MAVLAVAVGNEVSAICVALDFVCSKGGDDEEAATSEAVVGFTLAPLRRRGAIT